MKLESLYKAMVEIGIDNDPRGREFVDALMARRRKSFEKLRPRQQANFDKESLSNPFADTRMLNGDPQAEIKKVIIGIDMESAELLLTDRLNEKGAAIDLVLAHHPEGSAFAHLADVMEMQAEIAHQLGVPINYAEAVTEERSKDVGRRLLPANHDRPVDTARLLGLNYMCCHTPTDNMVTTWLSRKIAADKPFLVGDLVELLEDISEYKHSVGLGAGPRIVAGNKGRRTGKVFVDFTGGTGGSKHIFAKLGNTEYGTIVGMHMSDENRKEALKHNLNVVIAGHISSDNLGINLMLDSLAKKLGEELEVVCASGFVRFAR